MDLCEVSVDGVSYVRKIDLKVYNGLEYTELLQVLESMFKLAKLREIYFFSWDYS